MKIKVIKIFAIGTNKRFIVLSLKGKEFYCRVSDELYKSLKDDGVPTSQWLRWHKQ